MMWGKNHRTEKKLDGDQKNSLKGVQQPHLVS